MSTLAEPHTINGSPSSLVGEWTSEMVETMFMLGARCLPHRGPTYNAWALMDWTLAGPDWSIYAEMRLDPSKTVWDCRVQSYTSIPTEPAARRFVRMIPTEVFTKVAELANMFERARTLVP